MSRLKNRYKTTRYSETFDGKGGMYLTLKDPVSGLSAPKL